MKRKIYWNKGVFTVEAAVIVPMAAVITALLIGFCFYTHQINWFKGAAMEAVAAGLKESENREEAARERIQSRSEERPLNTGNDNMDVSSGIRLAVSFQGRVLENVFGSLFSFSGEEALIQFDPTGIKRQEFILKGIMQ